MQQACPCPPGGLPWLGVQAHGRPAGRGDPKDKAEPPRCTLSITKVHGPPPVPGYSGRWAVGPSGAS